MSLQHEVILSSLLTDFDRFYQAPIPDFISEYKQLFSKYFDVDCLKKIVGATYESKSCEANEQLSDIKLAVECVKEARDISLTQTDKRGGEKEKDAPDRMNLKSVFSRVKITDKPQDTMHENKNRQYYGYNFAILTPNGSYPTLFDSETSQDKLDKLKSEHKQLVNDFKMEMNAFSKNSPESFSDFLVPFEALLKKYLWCITASDYDREDISLYDHARITSAIANSLYIYRLQGNCENTNEYKLIAGNFSGIQKYIFSLSSTNTSKVAKRLRARSFFVDATVGAFAQTIIDCFDVPRFHILMLTGGKFYILLPNTKDAEEKMNTISKQVETELFEKFNGQLSTNLAWIDVAREGLVHYGESIYQLSKKLNARKQKPFEMVLKNEDGWLEDKFVLYDDIKGKRSCPVCRSFFIDKDDKFCPICKQQEDLGRQLPYAKYIAYFRKDKKEGNLRDNEFSLFSDYHIRVIKNNYESEFQGVYYIEQIFGDEINQKYFKYPISFEYRANYVPIGEDRTPKTFDAIAKTSEGKKYIAVLKADVDNLGYIFTSGLKGEKDTESQTTNGKRKDYGTISRVNTMSRLFTIFFSGKIQEILRTKTQNIDGKDNFENVYSVFAGGDDLFLIGPWSVMPNLAKKIQEEFAKFVGYNPEITLSATVDLYHFKTHIATMAEVSEEHLGFVKNPNPSMIDLDGADQITYHKDLKPESRNGIQFFGQIMNWEDFGEQLSYCEVLYTELRNRKSKVDVTLLRRISECSQMYQRFLAGDVSQLSFKSRLYYIVNRKFYEKGKLLSNQSGKKEYVKQIDLEKKQIKRYIVSMNSFSVRDRVNKELFYASSCIKNVMTRKGEESDNNNERSIK